MSKINIPPFYIGQKVIYITGNHMPKDSKHTVTDIQQNECGCWSILFDNLGPTRTYNPTVKYICQQCKKPIIIPKTVD